MRQNRKFTGNLGEEIATNFLKNKGFKIVERNYSKKWGEIDIIARKNKVLHFIEVKTQNIKMSTSRPEEKVDERKLKKIHRVIESYLAENNINEREGISIDVVSIILDIYKKKAKINFIENIV